MENAHSAFFAVVMHPKEAAGDRTCESADQLVVLMNRLLKGAVFLFKGQLLLNDEMCYYKESVKISGVLGEETYGSNTDAGRIFYGCDHLGVCSEKSRIF